jgi:hypothetical protein
MADEGGAMHTLQCWKEMPVVPADVAVDGRFLIQAEELTEDVQSQDLASGYARLSPSRNRRALSRRSVGECELSRPILIRCRCSQSGQAGARRGERRDNLRDLLKRSDQVFCSRALNDWLAERGRRLGLT